MENTKNAKERVLEELKKGKDELTLETGYEVWKLVKALELDEETEKEIIASLNKMYKDDKKVTIMEYFKVKELLGL